MLSTIKNNLKYINNNLSLYYKDYNNFLKIYEDEYIIEAKNIIIIKLSSEEIIIFNSDLKLNISFSYKDITNIDNIQFEILRQKNISLPLAENEIIIINNVIILFHFIKDIKIVKYSLLKKLFIFSEYELFIYLIHKNNIDYNGIDSDIKNIINKIIYSSNIKNSKLLNITSKNYFVNINKKLNNILFDKEFIIEYNIYNKQFLKNEDSLLNKINNESFNISRKKKITSNRSNLTNNNNNLANKETPFTKEDILKEKIIEISKNIKDITQYNKMQSFLNKSSSVKNKNIINTFDVNKLIDYLK